MFRALKITTALLFTLLLLGCSTSLGNGLADAFAAGVVGTHHPAFACFGGGQLQQRQRLGFGFRPQQNDPLYTVQIAAFRQGKAHLRFG